MPLVNLEGLKNLVSVFDFSFPFSREYAEFFKENYSKEIMYYESRGNVVPLQFLGREPLKQAQLLAAPENNGKQIEGKELVDFLKIIQIIFIFLLIIFLQGGSPQCLDQTLQAQSSHLSLFIPDLNNLLFLFQIFQAQ